MSTKDSELLSNILNLVKFFIVKEEIFVFINANSKLVPLNLKLSKLLLFF